MILLMVTSFFSPFLAVWILSLYVSKYKSIIDDWKFFHVPEKLDFWTTTIFVKNRFEK